MRKVALQSPRLIRLPLVVAGRADADVRVADAVPERASWPATARHATGMATFQANPLAFNQCAGTGHLPRFGRPVSSRQENPAHDESISYSEIAVGESSNPDMKVKGDRRTGFAAQKGTNHAHQRRS